MKKFLVIITSIFLLFQTTFATTAISKAPSLSNSTATTLDISWEKVSDWVGYYVYYSTSSWKNYKTFWDAFAQNQTTITDLQPNTTYYVVVTAFDSNNTESYYSPEWVFNTKSSFWDKFALNEMKALNFNEIELNFNASLDSTTDAIREFKITQNEKVVATVIESTLDDKEDNKLVLKLSTNLAPWEYKLTIIYITDKTWRNIEDWVDWETKFLMPSEFENLDISDQISWNLINNSQNTDNDASTTSVVVESWNVELNAASWNVELNAASVTTTLNDWLAWKAMEWVWANEQVVAGESKNYLILDLELY